MLKQYKRKLVLENIIKGSLWGLALGLVVSAILVMSFLLAKLTTWPYITIEVCGGVLAMLVTAVIYCVVKNPKEGDVAKRIDSTYDLKEKCATMVEFQGKSSFLIDRQREDAKVEVKKQNPKKMTVKLAVWTLPAIVLGASLLTTSLFTNQIKEGFNTIVNPGNNGKDFNDRTDDIIKDIEDYISKSDASEEFKQELFAILEKLQADLENDTDIASRTEKVKDAQGQVDDALNRVNVKEEIGLALQTHGDTFFIKVGIGMFNGDTGISDNQIITDGFHWLEDNTEIKKSATNKDKDGYLTMYPDGNEYLKPYSLSDIRSDGAKLGSYLDTWAAHIDDSLKASKVESTDEIYGIFNILSTKLKAYSPEAKACGSSNGAKITTLKQGIYTAFEQALSDLITDVQIENSNTALAEEVKKKWKILSILLRMAVAVMVILVMVSLVIVVIKTVTKVTKVTKATMVTAEAMVTVVIKMVTKVTRAIKVNKVIKETTVIIKETKAMAKMVLKAMAKVKEVADSKVKEKVKAKEMELVVEKETPTIEETIRFTPEMRDPRVMVKLSKITKVKPLTMLKTLAIAM